MNFVYGSQISNAFVFRRILLYSCLLQLSISFDVIILTPDSSEGTELALTNHLPNIYKIILHDPEEALNKLYDSNSPKILINLYKNPSVLFKFSKICNELEIIHIVFSDNLINGFDFTFSLEVSRINHKKSLRNLIGFFNWTSGVIFNSQMNNYLRDDLMNFSSSFTGVTVESESDIEEIVGRIVMPLGENLFYVFCSPDDSLTVQN